MCLRPEHTARARARRLLRLLGICERCRSAWATERHHRDGDVWNNARVNLECLCQRCHQAVHVRMRLEQLEREGQLRMDVAA